MMRIDSVASRPDRGGRYTVKLSDGSVMRLYRQTVEDFSLYPGRELEGEELQRLREAAGNMSARMRAVRIVTASNISVADLQQRLVQKGEDPEQAQKAVQWMQDLDLVDDEKTARSLVERCIAKGYGRARAKQVLFEKRIPKHLWDVVLENYPDQEDKISEFLQSRRSELSDPKLLKRVVDALLRKGHRYGDIRQALQRMQIDPEDIREDE